tara:strand:- start:277 stop:1554 length:1278 start_codon:yes stop_codon:yes gene_type:complete
MAKISVPKKSRKTKNRAAARRKTGIITINWDGALDMSGQEFGKKRRLATDELYQTVKHVEIIPFLHTWMKKEEYSKEDIRAVKAAPHVPINAAINAKLLLDGMPDLHQGHVDYWTALPGTGDTLAPASDYIKRIIVTAIQEGSPLVEAKAEADRIQREKNLKYYKPTIQEVMKEASLRMTEEIEEFVENFIVDSDPATVKNFEPHKVLVKVGAKANHARVIRSLYEGEFAEFTELMNLPNATQRKKLSEYELDMVEQLEEGFSHYSTAQKKAALEMYKKILDACDMIITTQKATKKPRKVKEKSADQLVAKMKYKKLDSDYGIASVSPSGLIGAVCAVVFNTKNRKLGVYVSVDEDGFKARGTTLLRYNEDTSLQKTLRKPQEQLNIFKKTTKVRTIKEFESTKTTETKLNGRFNDETVILAVFK